MKTRIWDGDGTFNTPPLVEAADTGPFFHNNAIATIEEAVAFYNSDAFNNSPAGQALSDADPNGVGIRLEATQVEAVAAFLRVLNALENIRQSVDLLERSLNRRIKRKLARELLEQAVHETGDTIRVLQGAGLHPQAIPHLEEARRLTEKATRHVKQARIREAIAEQKKARAFLN